MVTQFLLKKSHSYVLFKKHESSNQHSFCRKSFFFFLDRFSQVINCFQRPIRYMDSLIHHWKSHSKGYKTQKTQNLPSGSLKSNCLTNAEQSAKDNRQATGCNSRIEWSRQKRRRGGEGRGERRQSLELLRLKLFFEVPDFPPNLSASVLNSSF